jgi:abortive infection bacteriophage resistance protein
MKYDKPPLDLDQQVERLIKRGMQGDQNVIRARLASVNYYRLSGYWYPFRNPDDTFKSGTTFEMVWRRYVFDRRLRFLVMDAIERLEVAVRSQLAYNHSLQHSTFAYAEDIASLPKFRTFEREDFLGHVRDETGRSHDVFVEHFKKKYGDHHDYLPVWMATEIMSFGTVLTFFRGSSRQVKQSVASVFGMPDVVFNSWLLTLSVIRNICAHHGRLWNRELGVKPFIPRIDQYPEWHTPVKVENNRIFAVLTICRHGLNRIAPQSHWGTRFRSLLEEFPDIPLGNMGIPVKWVDSPIWKECG